ncbi:MtrAB system histidine kinase MtrB [Corynebacterium hansenii]|uniref:Sensor histidine kinase MtrB n=1 Tax=Corynebacterium hansenii TaxID=394964 RepID=A0ABV7ZKB4_9CORY|nr:MtrAB system histidine kinase MtrB [Corynebacterium hansenii]WJY99174.1 Sensor histidine kinase MtrB [Corynebacterium hansenii]
MAEDRRRLGDRLGAAWRRALRSWRTSLQVRVVTSVMVVSVLVVGMLGFALVSIVAQRLLDAKFNVANEEIDRARVVVEQTIAASGADGTQAKLNVGREALADRETGATTGSATIYEAVLIATGADGETVRSPVDGFVPTQLRPFIQQGQISYQYATMEARDGSNYSALVIGTPTSADVPGLELYLVMPLTAEESTLALVRGLFAGATVVMTLLLVGITWLFANQVTGPVRSAARISERFAAGHLRERMAVEGEDEMARLAVSFNKMAESLALQIQQLEEYGDLQRQFTSDVSHELRTPLTTVRMAADLIADAAEDLDPATRRASELMIAELDRFEMLLADLLEISRHDAGVAELSAERVDMRRCIDAAHQPLQVVAQESGTQVVLDVPDEPVPASVDSRRVERVLRNLMANAIDHSEGNPVVVALRADDRVVACTVTDHGVGLKPEQEELVFNRFWRADPSRERRTGGTGLGLAIAREDVLLHGGRLEGHGVPGVGSCFRLLLPLEPGGPVDTEPLPLEVPGAPAPVPKTEVIDAIAVKREEREAGTEGERA